MLTPDDIREILSDLPEDLKKRVEDRLICLTVDWDPLRRRVPVPPRGYVGCEGGGIYLHATSGDLETGDFIGVDRTRVDVLRQVEASVMAMERGRADEDNMRKPKPYIGGSKPEDFGCD